MLGIVPIQGLLHRDDPHHPKLEETPAPLLVEIPADRIWRPGARPHLERRQHELKVAALQVAEPVAVEIADGLETSADRLVSFQRDLHARPALFLP